MKKIGKYLFLTFILLFCINVFSLEVTLFADKTEVFKGENFRFTVNIEDHGRSSVKPVFEELTNVRVLSQGTSYNTTIVNFKSSVNYQFVYQAVSTSTGEIIIGPATIEVDGKKYSTKKLVLKCVDRAKSPSSDSDFIVMQETDKKEYFIGEEIKYTILFATSLNRVRNFRMTESELFKDFVTGKSNDKQGEKIINGKRYTVLQIDKTFFPLKTGDYNIDDLLISVDVASSTKRRSSFDNSFFEDSFTDDFFSAFSSSWQTKTISPDNISFKVKQLPKTPSNFSDGVGEFNIIAKLEEGKRKQGEPFQVKYIIYGKGNLSKIKRPIIHSNDNFSVSYSGEEFSDSENKNSGEKIFSYILIPEQYGDILIPEGSITYFDIEKSEYITKKTDKIKINIQKNDDYKGVIVSTEDYTNSEGDIIHYKNSATGKDIEYISMKNNFSYNSHYIRKFLLLINYIVIFLILIKFMFKLIFSKMGNKKRVVTNTINSLKNSLDKGDFLFVFNNIYWKTLCSVLKIKNENAPLLIIEKIEKIFPDDDNNKRLLKLNEEINFAAYSGKAKQDIILLFNEAKELLYYYAGKKGDKI
ncbi:MAG: BatD family protein [Candidatus Muirbacterium halophilum]|nr:BatD family protein [Candidatus Muirbacterium halophilum]MCK9474829.1 BatD family protein [Candidatus Muirbacterium halophilum]